MKKLIFTTAVSLFSLTMQSQTIFNLTSVHPLDAGVFDLIEELQQASNNSTRRVPLLNAFGLDASLYDDASPQYNVQSGKEIPWMHLVHQNTIDRIYGNNRFKDSLVANSYPNVSLFDANPYDHETINLALGNPLDSIGETQSVMAFYSHCLANNLTTGINETSFKTQIYIYPNPTSTTLFIKAENNDLLQYQVTNLIGQTIQQGSLNGNSIDVSSLSNGIYIFRITTNEKQTSLHKFIKR